jgi:molybdopterin-containing oxidoreductase family iron-sulfur binding subunit
MSGASMDQWIAPEPGTEIFIALGLAHEVAGKGDPRLRDLLAPYSAERVAERTGVPAERIRELAARIRDAGAPLALPPGNELQGTNATPFAAAVQILNWVSGAVGKTVVFGPNHNVGRISRFRDVKELAGKMRGGEVDVLFVHGTNPLYAVPAAFGFDDALRQVPFVVSLSSAADETTALAQLVLPTHTPFESWGDAEPIAGIRRLQQPTIRPLFDTRELGDVLLDLARSLGRTNGLPSGSFRDHLVSRWGGPAIDAALANGGVFQPADEIRVELAPGVASLEFAPAQLGGQDDLVLVAYPSLHFYDGRSARLNRLQEIPDPVTKSVWGSYAELHPETAAALGIAEGDVVRVRTEDGKGEVELPAFPHEAVRRGVVAIMVGQGHVPLEPDLDLEQRWDQHDWLARREVHGVNVLSMLPGRLDPVSGGLAWYSARVRVEKTGEWRRVNKTQPTFDQESRGLAQATTLAALAGGEDLHEAPHMQTQAFDPADDPATAGTPYRWGMSIDLDACNGCNACVSACAQENNIPTIGPDMTARGREMFWIRIERYVEHNGDELDVRDLPMLCQHCGAAPCENVCPVLATYHNPEGLNVMVYNRCIGTRYCSNNCPYKVRRFNYLPYDFEVREPEQLALNPDVTVRTKGVMEKCSFCIQRIQYAKDQADQEGRSEVRDGDLESACQQSCPARAIVFGNLKDAESQVSRLRADDRRYLALEHLYTQPAVSYLKKIRRGPTHSPHDEHHG